MTATQHIRELFKGLPNGTAFFLSDVVEDTSMVFGIERSAARNLAQQVIVKMLEDGELERADRGVYYKTSGQGVGESFDQDRILRCYLFDVHGHRIGYEDGARLAYEIGILPEKPAFRGIVTNRMVNGYQPALYPVGNHDFMGNNFGFLHRTDDITAGYLVACFDCGDKVPGFFTA